MSYTERKTFYECLSQKRNNPLVTYVTSIRPNLGCNMASDAIAQIIQQIRMIPAEYDSIDFLIISNGGDPITALRIMSLLRERFSKITVLLPYVAYSAATILSLGADEIIMHPYSNLGPVDPQLSVAHNTEKGVREHLNFSSEDLRNYVDFIRSDVGITDQQHLVAAVSPLIKDVGALPIGSAKRSQQLSLTLSEKMLGWHFSDNAKIKSIAKSLISSYYHHGYAVGRKEATDIGLPIVSPDQETEDLLWKIWEDFEHEMKCQDSFDIIKEIKNDPDASQKLSQIPVVMLPANTPPDVAKQIIIQRAQATPVTMQKKKKKRVLIGSIESVNLAKAVYNDIDIVYWRNADYSLGFNCTITASGWIDYN